jgi:branched-chain amino acid transport system ATP-binding protein
VVAAVSGERPALSARGLDVGYGRVQVCFGVDLELAPGTVGALLGTNGAGKSTILRAVAGLVPSQAGRVELFGQDLTRWPVERRVRHGLALVAGGQATFPSLTIEENLRVGAWCRPHHQPGGTMEDALGRFPQLAGRARQRAGSLSGGEQHLLALARALVAGPRVLMIDELTLGLAPSAAEQVMATVVELAAGGTTILLVEQSISRALAVAATVWFLQRGEIRYAGPPSGLAARADLLQPVLGEPR